MAKKITNCSSYGKLMLFLSIIIAAPIFVVPFYPQDAKYIIFFLIPSVILVTIGIVICYATKNDIKEGNEFYGMENGSITVLLIWVTGFVAGAIPFVLSGELTFVQSLFEAVSGFTTTGLSVMDVTDTPHIFLFHRGFMQFCGGLGFVMVMVMFVQGKQAMSLYNAEGHPDKLMPNLGKTARTIFLMYVSFLVIGTISYILCGMEVFDSIIHTMCALSTGGFSTKVDSIGAYNSLAIEVITMILMLIGTTNFAVLLLLVRKKIKQMCKVSEMRFMFFLTIIATPILAFSLFLKWYLQVGESFRVALFNVISAFSTTGFSTMSYNEWPVFSIGIMILLMLIGGGIGSTAGGLKMTRVYLMIRMVKENIKKRFRTSRTVSNPYYYRAQGKTHIDKALELDTIGFIVCYLFIFTVGSLLITLTADCSLSDAMFEFASSLGTVGLSIGLTNPTTNNATLIIEIIGMMMGRLEIFIIFIGIHSGYRKVKKRVLKIHFFSKTKI